MTAEPFDSAAGNGGLLSFFLEDDTGTEPWMSDSLCAQIDPEMFFPEKGGSTREAKRICLRCDVRSECLDYALRTEERFGIWGGLSERERRRLKRGAAAQDPDDDTDDGDDEQDEESAAPAAQPPAEVVQLRPAPVYDNTVTVRQAEPVLVPLTGDSRLLVLNCLSAVAANGGHVTNFRQLLRRLSFSSEQQFLRFLRMQERRGYLECQLTSVSASRISITQAGRNYLADSKFGQSDQRGSDGMKDSKRFPAIRAYVEALPGQILVVGGGNRSVDHALLRAAKLDNVSELRRVLRKLGREVLDAELTEDPDDGSMMLVFGQQTAAAEESEAAAEIPAEIQAELVEDAGDELTDPAGPETSLEADAQAETAPEQGPALPAGPAAVAAEIPRQRKEEPANSVAGRHLAILRWFADQGGEVPTPGPKAAEQFGMSLLTARHDLQGLRHEGLLASRGNTRNTVYFLTAAGWEQLGPKPIAANTGAEVSEDSAAAPADEPVLPQEEAADEPDSPADSEPVEASSEPESAPVELTPLQAAALRWFARQKGDIYAPRPRLAADLGITRTAAKKLIYGLRAGNYLQTDGPTVTCRYFLTEAGWSVAAALPETAELPAPPENKCLPEAALAISMARTRALLQALADTPEQCWQRCKAVDINLRLPSELRFSDSSDLNKFLRRLALSGLVEQECKGSHRAWLKITAEGLDWLKLSRPGVVAKDLELAQASQDEAEHPVTVMAHAELPRSLRAEEARVIEVCRMLYGRPNRYWSAPAVQEINDQLPEWLRFGNPANLNVLIRMAEARGVVEQAVNGRRRLYVRLTDLGAELVESHMAPAAQANAPAAQVAEPEPEPELTPEEARGEVLRMAERFWLPLDAIVKRFAILGTSGSGKTSTAVVMVEEMIRLGWPVVILDPQGVWWGLRSSADGQSPGLPVLVIGGEHGDIPLEASDGWKVARMLEELRRPVVIDTYDLDDEQAAVFTADFFDAIYERPRLARPIHLVVDEADEFAPQFAPPGSDKDHVQAVKRLKRAALRLAKRGRTRGIGQTWITQRPQEFHKGVLGQLEVLVAMRFSSVRDIQVINEWLSSHNGDAEVARVKTVLPELETGTGLFYCPHWLGPLKKVAVRPRWTFDSSATPDPRQPVVDPEVQAEVDLSELEPFFGTRITGAPIEDDYDELDEPAAEAAQETPVAAEEAPAAPEPVVLAPAAVAENAQAMVELMQKHLALALEHDRVSAELRRVQEELLEAEVARSAAETESQALRERVTLLEQSLAEGRDTADLHRKVMQALVDQLPPSTADKVILSLVGAG